MDMDDKREGGFKGDPGFAALESGRVLFITAEMGQAADFAVRETALFSGGELRSWPETWQVWT